MLMDFLYHDKWRLYIRLLSLEIDVFPKRLPNNQGIFLVYYWLGRPLRKIVPLIS